MRKRFNWLKWFPVLLLLALAPAAKAQTAPTQTTLSAAQGVGPTPFSGTVTAYQTFATVASTTGLIAQGVPLQVQSIMYIDQEAEAVVSFNSTTGQVQVTRGYLGTTAQPHVSGTMVLIGPPGAFNSGDPTVRSDAGTQNAGCVAANTAFTPYINVITGKQWLCSTITNTWVPGFNNTQAPPVVTAAVASAATIVPTGPLFHITGTTSMVNVTTPVGCNATAVGGCQFTAICDGVCAWTAAGNISAASGTFVAATSVTFTWDATNSKWVPSNIT